MNEKCWYKDVCEMECGSSCIRYLEMEYLVDNSGIPIINRYPVSLIPDDVDYDAFCKLAGIKDNILEFVNTGKNLFISSSNTGNGKTSWSIKLLLKYFDQVWAGNGFRLRGLFIHTPTLLTELKNFNDPLSTSYKDNILSADLVVWDDIASTEMTNYDLTQLLIYVDNRIMNGKSNIYTGNVDSNINLQRLMGVRLASRIWNTSELVVFRGKDRRVSNGSVAGSF